MLKMSPQEIRVVPIAGALALFGLALFLAHLAASSGEASNTQSKMSDAALRRECLQITDAELQAECLQKQPVEKTSR
jgi:ABC-type Fe3+-hydroxamate transport system substrate-binding protein